MTMTTQMRTMRDSLDAQGFSIPQLGERAQELESLQNGVLSEPVQRAIGGVMDEKIVNIQPQLDRLEKTYELP
eukprot:2596271-Pyramimonas_sp.AAC.1